MCERVLVGVETIQTVEHSTVYYLCTFLNKYRNQRNLRKWVFVGIIIWFRIVIFYCNSVDGLLTRIYVDFSETKSNWMPFFSLSSPISLCLFLFHFPFTLYLLLIRLKNKIIGNCWSFIGFLVTLLDFPLMSHNFRTLCCSRHDRKKRKRKSHIITLNHDYCVAHMNVRVHNCSYKTCTRNFCPKKFDVFIFV